MKKFLIAFLTAAILMFGVSSGNANLPTGELPAHIQRMENIVNNESDGPYLNFVDYRDTDATVWIWVDNTGQPGLCNFVVVLGVIDKTTDKYVPLMGFNEMNTPDPCGSGYQAFTEYVEQVEALRKKRGI
jgi:hypothetical protein